MGRLLRNRSGRATFLCYHSVAPQGPEYLTVGADLFERQLDELVRRRIGCGGAAELASCADGTLAAPTAFLTFDDGFLDNYQTVLPLLRERGLPAFCFVVPPLLAEGGAFAWPEVAADQERFSETMRSITWAQAEEMAAGGFEIGSHTLTHRRLALLGPEELRQELSDSRAAIRERLGRCETIAYPFGEWSPEVAAATRECGYRYAFTLPGRHGQWRAGPHSIPRLNVDYRDEPDRFARKLTPLGKEAFLSPAVAPVKRALRKLRGRPEPGSA